MCAFERVQEAAIASSTLFADDSRARLLLPSLRLQVCLFGPAMRQARAQQTLARRSGHDREPKVGSREMATQFSSSACWGQLYQLQPSMRVYISAFQSERAM
jgi:hypothetical protein